MRSQSKSARQKANLNSVFRKFHLTHLTSCFSKSMTPRDFSELQPESLGSYARLNGADVTRLRDAVEYVRGILNSPSPSSTSEVLDGTEECDPLEGKENVQERHRRYTARGTTVLTRTPDNREIKRKSRIVVAIRKRPLNPGEQAGGLEDVMESNNTNEIILKEPKVKVDLRKYTHIHRFYFDEVFDETCTNESVYQRTARALIDTVIDGGLATCFAYGQTGSGKTHTMLGKDEEPGLYVLAAQDLYERLGPGGDLVVSFYEIYGGRLYDLLNRRQLLRCLEDEKGKVNVRDLTEHTSGSVEELMYIIEQGSRIRSSGCTGANDTSSRSHAILELKLRMSDTNGPKCSGGKFTFIDLAGSERGADTIDCARQIRMEGAEINKSLLALKECIRFLDQNKKHVPFRGSKLTEVLRDSFVGNCRTVMIGTVSPSNNNCEHTLNTLRYADRVKELKRSAPVKPTLEENEQKQMFCLEKSTAARAGRLSVSIPATLNRLSPSVPPLTPLNSILHNRVPAALRAGTPDNLLSSRSTRRSCRLSATPRPPPPQAAASMPVSPPVPTPESPPLPEPQSLHASIKRVREEPAPWAPSSPNEAGLKHGGSRQEDRNNRDEVARDGVGPESDPSIVDESTLFVVPAYTALRQSTIEAYKHYLDVDMFCIREEHQIKFNAEHSRISDGEFVQKARELVEAKRNSMNSFLACLAELEKADKPQ